jgi:hypothetical protein
MTFDHARLCREKPPLRFERMPFIPRFKSLGFSGIFYKKRHKTWHGVRRGVNWGYAKTSETIRKLGCTGGSVGRFLEMTTASVNRMARPEEMTEVDG